MRLLLVTLILVWPAIVSAQHPSAVQQALADGEYFQSLVAFEKMPRRKATPEAFIAAARSSWALSLPTMAIQYFDRALQDNGLNDEARARAYLSRGVIEFQEGRFEAANLFAERAINTLPESSPLRSKVWLLWAEGLNRLGAVGPAEEKYINGLDEAMPDERPEIHFALGSCQEKLGKLAEARASFEQIPLSNERAPSAMRSLARLALKLKDYVQVSFWLDKGRADYADYFVDSWVDYALSEAAIQSGDTERVLKVRDDASKKYPPSDHWLTLLNAGTEVYLGRQMASVKVGGSK